MEKKRFSHLKKNNYFVSERRDVTCQTTGRCVRRPAWNETPADGSQITILKGHARFFLCLASSDRPNFLGLSKKKRKKKRQSWSFFTLINSFNFKDEHYNNISSHKRFGGVSILLWNRPSYFPPYWVCFDLVTMSCSACVTGAWKWWAQERTGSARETRVSPRAHVLYRALLRSACYTAICLVVFKLHHRKPTLLFVNCTWKLNER